MPEKKIVSAHRATSFGLNVQHRKLAVTGRHVDGFRRDAQNGSWARGRRAGSGHLGSKHDEPRCFEKRIRVRPWVKTTDAVVNL